VPTTPSNLHALLGCLAGYVLAALIATGVPLDESAAALLTAFLPSATGLVAWLLGRHFDP